MASALSTRLAVIHSAVRQQIWRTATPLYFKAIGYVVPRLLRPASAMRRAAAGCEIRVVGLLSTATGIGQSARLCVTELKRGGYSVATHNLSRLFSVDDAVPFEAQSPASQQAGISIYHVNPPMMLLGILAGGLTRYRRDINIAYWAWELPQLPSEWLKALHHVDAVIVPSNFCRSAVSAVTDKPVLVVPHPVPIVAGRCAEQQVRQPKFRVLTVFNCGSSLFRKNPWASIRAFKRAFGDDRSAELVLKIGDGRHHKADLARLLMEIGDAPNIRIIDELMGSDALDALLRSTDVYISLHRSEGFGLTVAEAIMREVPVVVTNWSGTTDFCPPSLAHCVDYELIAVDDPHPVYHELRGARWADASVEAAARHLVAIRDNPVKSRAQASQLRERLIGHLTRSTYSMAIASIMDRAAVHARVARSAGGGADSPI